MNKEELRNWLDEYIIGYSFEKNMSQKTIRLKKIILERFYKYSLSSTKPFGAPLCRDFSRFMFDNGWEADDSRLNVVKNLRAFVNFLHKRKHITENFSHELEKPEIRDKSLVSVSEKVAEEIIIAGTTPGKGDSPRSKYIKNETREGLIFILLSGIRPDGLIKLRKNDFNLDDDPPSYFLKNKGGSVRVKEIPRNAIEVIKARKDRERTFEVTLETMNFALKRGCEKLGIDKKVTCRTLRHVFSLSRLNKKEPLQMVSRLLDHKKFTTTDQYYSKYVLSDLSHTLNNTSVLQEGLSKETVIEDIESDFRKKLDSRLTAEYIKNTKKKLLTIKVYYGD